ncbi:MAG: sodium:solute symporter family transporter, partial [Bacteroidota bacterium]
MEEPQSLVLHVGDQAMLAFIGYLVMIVVAGLLATRFSSKGISNFFIGGRQMSMFVVAISAVVSGRSAWLLLGFTGMAFTMGFSALWAAAGYIIAELFLFLYFAPRIRHFSEVTDCITIPDFFEERFADKTGILRAIVAIIIIVFMLAYVSAQFVAGGKTFSAGFELTSQQGILLTAVIILFYTVTGGFLAVSITDTIQGLIMIIALVVLPVIVILHLGGFGSFYQHASAIETPSGSFTNAFALGTGALIGFLGIGLGSVGNPHIIARYMSIKDKKKLKMTAVVGTLSNVIMAT